MLDNLAIVVAVKQSQTKPDCALRLKLLLSHLKNICSAKVIVSDSSHLAGRLLIKAISHLYNAQYVHNYSRLHTPGINKNLGAEFAFMDANIKFVLFIDVDVILTQGTIQIITSHIKGEVDFDWFPVAFLNSSHGRDSMKAYVENTRKVFDKKDLYQIGYVTGIQVFSKNTFCELNGYNSDFYGYGCEDIELLHRASYHVGIRPLFHKENSYFIDHRTSNLSEYTGYRKWYYNVKSDFKFSDMPIHFYHARKTNSEYLKSRPENDEKLKKLMVSFDQVNMQT